LACGTTNRLEDDCDEIIASERARMARIILNLLQVLHLKKPRTGLAAICRGLPSLP
jgi:hypothetical protein